MADEAAAQPGVDANTITVENATTTAPVTTAFGLGSLSKPTPMWAKNAFVIFYSMNASVIAYLGLTKLIPASDVVELVLLFKFIIDPLCYIVSRMIGVSAIVAPPDGK